jgi:hypothetical protein
MLFGYRRNQRPPVPVARLEPVSQEHAVSRTKESSRCRYQRQVSIKCGYVTLLSGGIRIHSDADIKGIVPTRFIHIRGTVPRERVGCTFCSLYVRACLVDCSKLSLEQTKVFCDGIVYNVWRERDRERPDLVGMALG